MRDTAPTLLLDERQAAAALGLTARTLQSWRVHGAPNEGPPLRFVRVSSRCIRYRLEDLHAFVAARLRISTADDGSNAGHDLMGPIEHECPCSAAASRGTATPAPAADK